MPSESRPSPLPALAAVALVSTLVVHALPLWLGTLTPSLGLVSVVLIASFFLGHPAMSLPLGLVLRREFRGGRPRRDCVLLGSLTGLASGIAVLGSHAFVDAFVLPSPTTRDDSLASLIHVVVAAGFGVATGVGASRPAEGTAA